MNFNTLSHEPIRIHLRNVEHMEMIANRFPRLKFREFGSVCKQDFLDAGYFYHWVDFRHSVNDVDKWVLTAFKGHYVCLGRSWFIETRGDYLLFILKWG